MGRLGIAFSGQMKVRQSLARTAGVINDRVLFFGDSITAASGGFADQFATAFPSFGVVKNAVSGTSLNTGANSFMSRQAAGLAQNAEIMVILPGANDLSDSATYATVAAWMAALYNFTDPFRAAGTKVLVIPPLPQGTTYPNSATHNTRRATARTTLLADVGTKIDGVIDLNATTLGPDSAANDTNLFSDGLHPTTAGHTVIATRDNPEVNYKAGYSNQPSQFTFTDVSGATTSTVYTSNTITIAGLATGESKSYSIAGAGFTVSKNVGAFSASSGTVINGDTLAIRGTSSASASTALTGTLTVGTVSDGYTLDTTLPLTTAYVSGAAGNGAFGASFTFTGLTTTSAKKHVLAIMSSNAGVPSAVSLGGNAASLLAAISTSGKSVSFWAVDIATGGTAKSLVVTLSGIWAVAYAMWTTDGTASFDSSQSLAYAYPNDPIRTPSVTLPAGGSILAALNSESAAATITPEGGTTERLEVADPGNWKFWAGDRAATGQPGVTGLAFAGAQMLAIALRP